jgi:hypothetical protein
LIYESLIATNLVRYTAPILFPVLDSYPASMFDVGSGQALKLAVHAGLVHLSKWLNDWWGLKKERHSATGFKFSRKNTTRVGTAEATATTTVK